MGALGLRPLWFVLIAIGVVGACFVATPRLDAWGSDLAEAVDADVEAREGALVAAAPWMAAMVLGYALSLWWVHAKPAWHPWRDSIIAAVVWPLAAGGSLALSGLVHRERLFDYYNPDALDIAGLQLYIWAPAVLFGPFAVAAIFVGLSAANRIWGTPTPRREDVFGPRA